VGTQLRRGARTEFHRRIVAHAGEIDLPDVHGDVQGHLRVPGQKAAQAAATSRCQSWKPCSGSACRLAPLHADALRGPFQLLQRQQHIIPVRPSARCQHQTAALALEQGTPRSSSSFSIWWLTAPCVRCTSWAARVKEPRRALASRQRKAVRLECPAPHPPTKRRAWRARGAGNQ
jgi:hypothetical protein